VSLELTPGISEVSLPVFADVSTGFNWDFKIIIAAVRKKHMRAKGMRKAGKNHSMMTPKRREDIKLFSNYIIP